MQRFNPALRGRSLLRLADLTDEELADLIETSLALKARRRAGIRGNLLERRQVALIFEKSSTRTRTAASIAIQEEGGNAEYLSKSDMHLGGKESVKDTARVLGRIFDGILYRGFQQRTIATLAQYAGVPVWNGLTDDFHPTQILADLMTIRENFGRLAGLKLAYVGDGRNNVANSLMIGCAKSGINYANCTPRELMPDPELVAQAALIARRNNATLEVMHDPVKGVAGANILYTDVWVSMGEEAHQATRVKLLRPFQVNMELMAATGNLDGELIFLHCLPAFHDHETSVTAECGAMEVSDEVFESRYSRVFDEAENRMHTIKALYVSAMADLSAI